MSDAATDYAPPETFDDPRICGRCRRSGGPWLIANSLTGKYHSGGDYGMTDCGVDATREEFLWPV